MSRPFVLALQHEQCEGLGTIAESLVAAGVDARPVRAFAGDSVPPTPAGAAGLVVMGGPMGVYDHPRVPYLGAEMRLIEAALAEGVPVLGVCLGSQLLAQVLGAAVGPAGIKEIGWYPVDLTQAARDDPVWGGQPPRFTAFHWHGDTFPLPPGAVPLASSSRCALQAFRFGAATYGIQFHLEVTDGMVRDMVRTWPDELAEEGLQGAGIVAEAARHLPGLRQVAAGVFGEWAGRLVA